MIFQYTWQAVLEGRKTQTARRVKPGDTLQEWHGTPAVLSAAGRRRWRVGQELAVQPERTAKAVGRIRITALRRADVRSFDAADARAEGMDSVAEFLSLWIQIHDPQFARHLAARSAAPADDLDALIARPLKFYDAWVIQFLLVK